MSSDGETKIAIIARSDTQYLRDVLLGLAKRKLQPELLFLGSPVERFLSKLDSWQAIRSRLGFIEAARRSLGSSPPVEGSENLASPTLEDILREMPLELNSYNRINEGQIACRLLKGRYLTLLAGAGIVDNSVILSSMAGCVNAHPAILPGLRGMDVVEWAIVDSLPIGITTHFVATKIDAGAIVLTESISPGENENYGQFQARILAAQAETLAEGADRIIRGTHQFDPHDLSKSTLKYRMPAALRAQIPELYKRYRQKNILPASP